jgi:hypothetical protein
MMVSVAALLLALAGSVALAAEVACMGGICTGTKVVFDATLDTVADNCEVQHSRWQGAWPIKEGTQTDYRFEGRWRSVYTLLPYAS